MKAGSRPRGGQGKKEQGNMLPIIPLIHRIQLSEYRVPKPEEGMTTIENCKSLPHRYHNGPIFESEFRASLGWDLVQVVGVLGKVTLSRADRNQDSAQNLLLALSTSFIRDRTVAER